MVESAGLADNSRERFVQKDIAGTYAFRFSGFTVALNIVYRLAGIGQMQIDDTGTIRGEQRSAITPLGGQNARLNRSVYRLDGKITLANDGTGSAKVRFGVVTGEGRDVTGNFDVQIAGRPDRLWFLSSGSTLPNASDDPVDEHVELEAIRMDKP
jgi:hypothetical protein